MTRGEMFWPASTKSQSPTRCAIHAALVDFRTPTSTYTSLSNCPEFSDLPCLKEQVEDDPQHLATQPKPMSVLRRPGFGADLQRSRQTCQTQRFRFTRTVPCYSAGDLEVFPAAGLVDGAIGWMEIWIATSKGLPR